MKILVSACLLGEPCRYDGTSKPVPQLEGLGRTGHTLVPVCPEVLGGLPTPRPPAELQPDGRVVNRLGEDVTQAYPGHSLGEGLYGGGAQGQLPLLRQPPGLRRNLYRYPDPRRGGDRPPAAPGGRAGDG